MNKEDYKKEQIKKYYRNKARNSKIQESYKIQAQKDKINETYKNKFRQEKINKIYANDAIDQKIQDGYTKDYQEKKMIYKYKKLAEVRTIYRILNNLSARINKELNRLGIAKEFTYTQILFIFSCLNLFL